MPQLIVRQIEEEVVRKLKERAGQHGVSMEEEHRRILRDALLETSEKKRSFKEYLLSMPIVGEDKDFERRQRDSCIQFKGAKHSNWPFSNEV